MEVWTLEAWSKTCSWVDGGTGCSPGIRDQSWRSWLLPGWRASGQSVCGAWMRHWTGRPQTGLHRASGSADQAPLAGTSFPSERASNGEGQGHWVDGDISILPSPKTSLTIRPAAGPGSLLLAGLYPPEGTWRKSPCPANTVCHQTMMIPSPQNTRTSPLRTGQLVRTPRGPLACGLALGLTSGHL